MLDNPNFVAVLIVYFTLLAYAVLLTIASFFIKGLYEPYYELESSADNVLTANVYIYERRNQMYGGYLCYKFVYIDDKWKYASDYKYIYRFGIFSGILIPIIVFCALAYSIHPILNLFFSLFIGITSALIICELLYLQIFNARRILLELIRKETEV